jgi:hypothetical protein
LVGNSNFEQIDSDDSQRMQEYNEFSSGCSYCKKKV